MAGHSIEGLVAKRASNPLWARALCLEDAEGRRAAVCVVDLMSASRYLLEKAASLTAHLGVTRENLVLVGTHTHTAPGHFYGATLYDQLAQKRAGFDPQVADHLAKKIAESIQNGFDALRPATLGVAEANLWGLTHNASLPAFAANPQASGWREEMNCPADMSPTHAAVDPRLTVLAAVADGEVFGTLAIYAGHNTALGSKHPDYDPDWFGVANRVVSERFGCAMLAPGAGSDLNVLRDDLPQGVELCNDVGKALAARWIEVVEEARAAATSFDVDVRFGVVDRQQLRVDDRPDTELGPTIVFGSPVLAGQEDGRSIFYHLGVARPGATSKFFAETHPQHPKARAFGPLHEPIRNWKELDISPELPLHTLRVAGLCIATLPGEPTVMMGQQMERALARDGHITRVVGYAGDYVGYLTTEEEFVAQHYEGASTLLGRNSARHLEARLSHIAETPPDPPAGGKAAFRTVVRRSR
jgi:neutral ceramidase